MKTVRTDGGFYFAEKKIQKDCKESLDNILYWASELADAEDTDDAMICLRHFEESQQKYRVCTERLGTLYHGLDTWRMRDKNG